MLLARAACDARIKLRAIREQLVGGWIAIERRQMTEVQRISVQAFLDAQESARESTQELLATIARVTADAAAVKVTPWTPDGACMCRLAFVVPMSAIEVSPTEITSHCCGQRIPVVRVHFVGAHGVVRDILRSQLENSARGTDGPPHEGDDCVSDCTWRLRQCVQYGMNHVPEGEQRERFLLHCADIFGGCEHDCSHDPLDDSLKFVRRQRFRGRRW